VAVAVTVDEGTNLDFDDRNRAADEEEEEEEEEVLLVEEDLWEVGRVP
jgi:hypothetical protein